MTLTDREKAAFIIGMVRAFMCGKWPKHFNADDKAQWIQRERYAQQMLNGGVFNPQDAWAVIQCADDELE